MKVIMIPTTIPNKNSTILFPSHDRVGKIEKTKDISLTHALDACSYYIALKHPIVKRVAVSTEW